MDGDALDSGRNGGQVQSALNADGDGDNSFKYTYDYVKE